MTRLLDQVVRAVSKLPRRDQDALAARWLGELESDRRWDASFAASQRQLEVLGVEALAEHRAGKTRPLVVKRK